MIQWLRNSVNRQNLFHRPQTPLLPHSLAQNHLGRVPSSESDLESIEVEGAFDGHSMKMMTLTICMMGLQLVWTVEMGYGTPYLASFGLSKSALTLAWLAGPLSGLIMQPIVGAWSDRCTSRWGKRRPFLFWGCFCIVLSLMVIGYAKPLAEKINPTPIEPMTTSDMTRYQQKINWVAILFAIGGFYILDFSINVVQAAGRALIVDQLDTKQQQAGNSWASAMISLGNILGYLFGSLKLEEYFSFLGDNQIKVLVSLASLVVTICVAITCFSVKEEVLVLHASDRNWSWFKQFKLLFTATARLPQKIRLVFFVQFFSWIAWFPFNFFGTEYVKEMVLATGYDQDSLKAVRLGSFSMFGLSIVSTISSFALPYIGRKFNIKIARIWSLTLIMFATVLLSTWKIHDYISSMIIVIINGVPLCATLWIPFALIGEHLSREEELRNDMNGMIADGYSELASPSTSPKITPKSNPIIRKRRSSCTKNHYIVDLDTNIDSSDYSSDERSKSDSLSSDGFNERFLQPLGPVEEGSLDAGLVLGVHNIFVVLPQVLSSFVSSLIFARIPNGPDSIGSVWRVVSIAVLFAAFISLKL